MRLPIVVALAAVVATCVGCSESTGGQATGSSTTTAVGSTTAAGTVPVTTTADSGMKGKTDFTEDDLCELLTTSEVQQLGGGTEEGEPSLNVVTEKPICKWSDSTVLIAAFRDDSVVANLKDGPGITKTKIQVNGLQAVQSDDKNNGGLCQVGIDLSDHSDLVVSVTVLTDQDKYKRCDVAKKMAAIVFSKVK